MPFIGVQQGGLDSLRGRLARASIMLTTMLESTMRDLGDYSVSLLSDAAPRGLRGNVEPPPIAGDAPGRLANSFHFEQSGNRVDVLCNQPAKLSFVVNGRGPVYPVRKRALYWYGLDHPVRYARASEPNDFITPVVGEIMAEAPYFLLDLVTELAIMLEGE